MGADGVIMHGTADDIHGLNDGIYRAAFEEAHSVVKRESGFVRCLCDDASYA